MKDLRALWRVLIFCGLTLVLLPVQIVAKALGWRLAKTLPGRYHKWLRNAFGIRVHVEGTPDLSAALVVANHVSWLDILVISSLRPLIFVAKKDVRSWPVIGYLAHLQGCLFVDRERRTHSAHTRSNMQEALQDQRTVVLFAEGTTSDGWRVYPFKTALIGALENTRHQHTLQPLALRYTHKDGLPLGRLDMPDVAWYGDMELGPHLWALLRTTSLDVKVTWCSPLHADKEVGRKELARAAENAVREALEKH